MGDAMQALVTAAAVVTALTVLLGALWWLVSPRAKAGLSATCREAVADALSDLDERLVRVEAAVHLTHDPGRLIELVDTLDLIRRHRPDEPAATLIRATGTGTPRPSGRQRTTQPRRKAQ